MIESLLESHLAPVISAEMRLRRRRLMIGLLSAGAIVFVGLALLAVVGGWWSWQLVTGAVVLFFLAGIVGQILISRRRPDSREIARRIEAHHPDLRSGLLAAMDQKPGPDGELSYLQSRLLDEVTEHATTHRWVRQVSKKRLTLAGWGQFFSLAGFVVAVWFLLGAVPERADPVIAGIEPLEAELPGSGDGLEVAVTPGDVELERGSRLIVEASFFDGATGSASLVHTAGEVVKRLPMQVGLDDAVFSALIPNVESDGNYRVEYDRGQSVDYSITTFAYPLLTKADALVTPPAYLKREPEAIPDTRKITVMEGSKIEWRLEVNQPGLEGELFGEDDTIIPLTADPDDPTILVAKHIPTDTQRYRVHLVDREERANQRPPWLTVNVKRNLPPKMTARFPGQDTEVSAIQEMPIEATVWDDVEVLRVGLSYQFENQESEIILADSPLPGGDEHLLETEISLEKLEAEPTDVLTYYLWAEDRDREGKVRRSRGEMLFTEVRYFEQIIREGTPQEGQPGESSPELLKLQKEIVNASWKLQRDIDLGKSYDVLGSDIDVLAASQEIVLPLVDEAKEKTTDPQLQQIYIDARAIMERGVVAFGDAYRKKDLALVENGHALALEAYAKLLEARSRETEITMSKNPTPGSSAEKQRNMNLELKQKELKYEKNPEAQEQSAAQTEDLAVLNRLKELAKRQEAIAEKIKELQNQLAEADEEEQKEIERQLKRLEEEQRELLRDLDHVSERMDSEKNRADMSEQREDLKKTRENIEEAAEKLSKGELAEATNAASRAQEELEEIKEEFREKTSRQFASEMKGLRDTARSLTEKQKDLGEQLEKLGDKSKGEPFSQENQRERGDLAEAIGEQVRELGDLVEEIKTLSEESEVSEPLLSDALYEAVRESMIGGVQESLEEARDLTYYNRGDQAEEAEQIAARGIEKLAESVEKAAEKVLGNEGDALRLARSELDRLIEQSQDETKRLAQEETQQGMVDDSTGSGEEKPGTGGSKGKDAPGGEQAGSSERERAGEQPGKGKGKKSDGEEGLAGNQPGKGKGKKSDGEEGLAGNQPGQGEGEKGKGKGKGGGEPQPSLQASSPGGSSRQATNSPGGDDRGNSMPSSAPPQALFFQQQSEQRESGPITGEDYSDWSDTLGNIEEMIPQEDLRNDVSQVLDDARSMRIEYRRDNAPPAAATIDQKITMPLLELRQRISEEIARMNRENPIAPIDRDPVPSEFRDLVRRYYEELGAGN